MSNSIPAIRKDVFVFASLKGGSGKTTSSRALADYLALHGQSVLAIDLDEQANFTNDYGVYNEGILEVLKEPEKINDYIVHVKDNFDLLPATSEISSLDQIIVKLGKERRLILALQNLNKQYDYVVIDCHPSFNLATTNAVAIPGCRVISPVIADKYGVKAIRELYELYDAVKANLNDTIKIEGFLFCMHSDRPVHTRDYDAFIEKFVKDKGSKVFKSKIRMAIAVREASSNNMAIWEYCPDAKVLADYEGFIKELLGEV